MTPGGDHEAHDPALAAAAEAAMRCVGVGASDAVIVLFNDEQRAIAEALTTAARRLAPNGRAVWFAALTRHGEEPPPMVSEAMAGATVIFAPTTFSLSHTRARMEATARGARIATMPGVTEATFKRAMPVDYSTLTREGERIASALDRATSCRITSRAGTDVVLGLQGRAAEVDDGNLQARGAFGNLPAGESFIAPVEDSAEGVVVLDGSLAGYGLLDDPIRLEVDGGRLVDAHGGEGARWLLRTLDAGGEGGRVLAELGIGTNPAATLSGSILEDEKVIGTAHLAFGTNVSFGGANEAAVHVDGVLLEPTIELDGRMLVERGTAR